MDKALQEQLQKKAASVNAQDKINKIEADLEAKEAAARKIAVTLDDEKKN